MRVVQVRLGKRSYRILVGSGLLTSVGRECRRLSLGRRCGIITDRNVGRRYLRPVTNSLKAAGFEPITITLPPGEAAKNLSHVASCYDQLAEHRLERSSFIVALGGGVVGDLAGFVAATYLRGVPLVQVATTLLAQVDSSVGGKVGVNLRAGKNLVGAFYQPRLVICDLDTLRTLPKREFKAGLAEVVKYGIIRDRALFGRLERQLDQVMALDASLLTSIVARCCQIKADVVGQDETETGLRAILNFGHTLGHAIEAISGYTKFLHGEAISIGQVAAAKLSTQLTGLPDSEAKRVEALFERIGLPTHLRLPAKDMQKLILATRLDKKVRDGQVRFVLATGIGRVQWGQAVPEKLLRNALNHVGR